MVDAAPLYEACRGKLQVALTAYTKKDGSISSDHVGGIYEIDSAKGLIWIWDTNRNDTIRKFFISNIDSFQVLDTVFFPPQPWPIQIDGEIII
jgi:hypothetical protein